MSAWADCRACAAEEIRAGAPPFDLSVHRMFVCPRCGNKRCPKADNHRFACTNNNEPDQKGTIMSMWGETSDDFTARTGDGNESAPAAPISITVDGVFDVLQEVLNELVEQRGNSAKAMAWDVKGGFLKRLGHQRTAARLKGE